MITDNLSARRPGPGTPTCAGGDANARHRDILAAEREERARVRSEQGIRRGGRPLAS